MFTRLKEIEICFENVEGIKVPAEYILVLCMDGIKNFRRSFQNDEEGLAMCRGTYAERISLKIDKSANIELKYVDGVKENIYADWEDSTKGGEENLLQKNSVDDRENLIIEIGKGDLNEYKKRKID